MAFFVVMGRGKIGVAKSFITLIILIPPISLIREDIKHKKRASFSRSSSLGYQDSNLE